MTLKTLSDYEAEIARVTEAIAKTNSSQERGKESCEKGGRD